MHGSSDTSSWWNEFNWEVNIRKKNWVQIGYRTRGARVRILAVQNNFRRSRCALDTTTWYPAGTQVFFMKMVQREYMLESTKVRLARPHTHTFSMKGFAIANWWKKLHKLLNHLAQLEAQIWKKSCFYLKPEGKLAPIISLGQMSIQRELGLMHMPSVPIFVDCNLKMTRIQLSSCTQGSVQQTWV